MADKKISQLNAAALPLAGTEVLPIVQSGATVKVTSDDLTVKNVRSNATSGILQVAGPAAASTRVMTTPDANFTAARIDAAQSFTGDQTLSTGNLVIGTAGKGIDFSADPSAAGMTSELLDDYEEGTWTPTIAASGTDYTAVTYNAENGGRYIKIGNVVHIQAVANATSITTGSPTGIFVISNLPFTSVASSGGTANGTSCIVVGYANGFAAAGPQHAYIQPNTSRVRFSYTGAATTPPNPALLATAAGTADVIVYLSGTYVAA